MSATPCPCKDYEPNDGVDGHCLECGHSGEEHNEHGVCLFGHQCRTCPCGHGHSHETDCWCVEPPAPPPVAAVAAWLAINETNRAYIVERMRAEAERVRTFQGLQNIRAICWDAAAASLEALGEGRP